MPEDGAARGWTGRGSLSAISLMLFLQILLLPARRPGATENIRFKPDSIEEGLSPSTDPAGSGRISPVWYPRWLEPIRFPQLAGLKSLGIHDTGSPLEDSVDLGWNDSDPDEAIDGDSG